MKPLSNDLRERILAAFDRHEGSYRKLAARFSVNVSTITKLLKLRRETEPTKGVIANATKLR